jgi:hypothetical protein
MKKLSNQGVFNTGVIINITTTTVAMIRHNVLQRANYGIFEAGELADSLESPVDCLLLPS